MIPFEFDYYKPSSVNEALDLLSDDGYFPLLGGTDLIVKMRNGSLKPKAVVDLKGIDELHFVEFSESEGLRIGAVVTLNELVENPLVREHYPTLWHSIRTIGAYQTRNRATLVGNIGNSSPAADSAPSLLIHNAILRIVGKNHNVVFETQLMQSSDYSLEDGFVTEVVEAIVAADCYFAFHLDALGA